MTDRPVILIFLFLWVSGLRDGHRKDKKEDIPHGGMDRHGRGDLKDTLGVGLD